MRGGGGKRDRHACGGHQHGADVRQPRPPWAARARCRRARRGALTPRWRRRHWRLGRRAGRRAMSSLSQAGSALAGDWAMSWNMRSLTKAASAGALMANSATKKAPQATERRWSATELVTPLRASRLGSAAVPSVRQRNSVSEIRPVDGAEGLQERLGARPRLLAPAARSRARPAPTARRRRWSPAL